MIAICWPTILLVASANFSVPSGVKVRATTYSFMPFWFTAPASLVYNLAAGLSAPIFNQHELKLLWNEAKSNQRIALLQYHEAALKAYEEVVNLATAHEKLTLRCELKEEESETHHRSIENAKELFQLSFVGYLEVLSADERYLDCELERIELNTAKCINHVYLYRSLGGGIIR